MPSPESDVSVRVLREAARLRVKHSSIRLAAREIGISHSTLGDFLKGSEPYGSNLSKLREWYGRETNEVIRMRLEIEALKQRIAELEAELRKYR